MTRIGLLALLLLAGCALTPDERAAVDRYHFRRAMAAHGLVSCTVRDPRPFCAGARLDITPAESPVRYPGPVQ